MRIISMITFGWDILWCNPSIQMSPLMDSLKGVKYFEDLFEIWAFLLWRSKWSTHVHQTKVYCVVILYYHRKRQAALLSQIYSHGTDRKENTLWTISNKACIVVPCLVVTQQRSLLPLSKETATVYRVYTWMKNSTKGPSHKVFAMLWF
jgi:hypothetical protein